MSNSIIPPGEAIRRAVKWISDQRRDQPDIDMVKLVDQACLRFDLSPVESETLAQTFIQKKEE
jgi:hypothetical protein